MKFPFIVLLSVIAIISVSCEKSDVSHQEQDQNDEFTFLDISYSNVTCDLNSKTYPFESTTLCNDTDSPIGVQSKPFVNINDYCTFRSDDLLFYYFTDSDILVNIPIDLEAEGLLHRDALWEISDNNIPWNSVGYHESFEDVYTVPPYTEIHIDYYTTVKLFRSDFTIKFQNKQTLHIDSLQGVWKGHFLYNYRKEVQSDTLSF